MQGREIGVFLALSRVPAVVGRIEQDLRRGCYIHLTKEAYMLFDAQYFIR